MCTRRPLNIVLWKNVKRKELKTSYVTWVDPTEYVENVFPCFSNPGGFNCFE